MNKENKVQNVLLILLAVAVVSLSIGLATYNATLSINGATTFEKAKWSILFKNVTKATDDSGEGTVTGEGTQTLTYSVSLAPGETFKVTANALNDGTFNAALKSITFGGKTPADIATTYDGKITYTFKYAGNTYTANQTGLNVALNAGNTSPIEIEIAYLAQEDEADLPITEANVDCTFSVTLGYEQV